MGSFDGSLARASAGSASTASTASAEQRKLDLLGRVGVFQSVSPLALVDVAALLQPHDVPAGHVVVREGEAGDSLYIVESGTLAVEVTAGQQATTIARLGPHEFFGERAALLGEPRSATVRAETAARLWVLGGTGLRGLLDAQPQLARELASTTSLREALRIEREYGVEHHNLATLVGSRSELRIGRAADNDLVLDSRLVSAQHAVLRRTGDAWELHDVGSTNGTYVNGAPIRRGPLKDGDRVWIADQRLVFDRSDLQRIVEPRGVRIDVYGLRKVIRGGRSLLQDISLSILPGEFVAIVGGSGAGKSTLMDAMSGVRPATAGAVLYNGADFYAQRDLYRHALGYVPQDDIIHRELPTRSTLEFAARLRLPLDTSAADRTRAVEQALADLRLTGQRDVVVGALSGGQRKRASIGVELLTQPRVFFLDEPTSGLDPATDTTMMQLLRDLSRKGSTVVLTTHATKNVALCDKVIILARGGHLAFVGSPARALQHFGVAAFDEIYQRLEDDGSPQEWGARFRATDDHRALLADQPPLAAADRTPASRARRGRLRRAVRQFRVLSRRTAELYVRNPARFAPLLGPPVLFSLFLIALIRGGLFVPGSERAVAGVQLLFLLMFSSFVFGLLYGVQEIVKEFPILRRERLVDLGLVPYVLSKTTFLAPVLVLSSTIILGMLMAADRLPAWDPGLYGNLLVTLAMSNLAGLGLALFTSAIAPTSQVATDLVTVWVMPQVFFAGGLVAVPAMGAVGRAFSHVASGRWSFEAIGRSVRIDELLRASGTPEALAVLERYGASFARDLWQSWAILAVFAIVPLLGAVLVLRARTRTA